MLQLASLKGDLPMLNLILSSPMDFDTATTANVSENWSINLSCAHCNLFYQAISTALLMASANGHDELVLRLLAVVSNVDFVDEVHFAGIDLYHEPFSSCSERTNSIAHCKRTWLSGSGFCSVGGPPVFS